MISGDSTDRSDFKRVKTRPFAYLSVESTDLSLARLFGKSRSLAGFLRTILNLRKRDRYFDTGESGETYDAEMEAAAAGI
jgi:hypothetical protein